MTTDQVRDAALALPKDARLELAETLLASVPADDQPPLHEGWREVIRQRAAEVASGQVVGVPWEEVRRRAREKASG
jgi:putative addiction module component (TIGR02574 family)